MTEPDRRRRRPAVSCALCRRRKIRCNREFPCSNCVRSKSGTCVYDGHPPLHHRPPPDHDTPVSASCLEAHAARASLGNDAGDATATAAVPKQTAATASLGNTPSGGSSTLAGEITPQDVLEKFSRFEGRTPPEDAEPPADKTTSVDHAVESTTFHTVGGEVQALHVSRIFGKVRSISQGVVHKRRYYGQTHWINGVILLGDIIRIIEPHLRVGELEAANDLQKCKAMARMIKAHRNPEWPTLPTSELPSKEVADELVDNYMHIVEGQHRVLHMPTFRKKYESLWIIGTDREPEFLLQVKLVLAIGATTYDETYSMREIATRWVYEALTWISGPHLKHRLTFQTLQTHILLLFARELVGVDPSSTWIEVGAVLRTAMHMGIHRDPLRLSNQKTFKAEMSRRLFNTILELSLASSMTSGGPPLISLDDFDTEPPGNFDDEQLMEDDPRPRPDGAQTDISTAIALRKSLPLRLTILRLLNSTGSLPTYQETLRLDTEFRAAYKDLRKAVQARGSAAAAAEGKRCTVRLLDLFMNRYLMALHLPFFSLSLRDKTYAFSRTVVIDACVKSWRAIVPDPNHHTLRTPAATATDSSAASASAAPSASASDLLRRLTICATGSLRTVLHEIALVTAAELAFQVREEESLGPVSVRPDLLALLECARDWFFRTVENGDTSVKGYMVMCIASAPVQCYLEGYAGAVGEAGGDGDDDEEEEELGGRVLRAAERAVKRCMGVLEGKMAEIRGEGGGGGGGWGMGQEVLGGEEIGMDAELGGMENWDFMMSGMDVDPGSTDALGWFFGDIGTQNSMAW